MYDTPYYRHRSSAGRATTIGAAATAHAQNTALAKLGLTIIAFIRPADRYQLLQASARVHEARTSFQRFDAETLHLTITGVLAHQQPQELSDEQRQQVEQAVVEVMQEELALMSQFAISLQGIEPGGDAKRPGGNVVAVASPTSRLVIERLGARLREKLNPRLAKIYPGLTAEPARGVKITLGFFNEAEDFRVDRQLALTLEELRHVETELWVERVALVRFRSKSLADAEIIHEVHLPKPAVPPIRQASFKPKVHMALNWALWYGFSYLWDNPGASHVLHARTGLEQIACEPWTDPALSLYRALGDALAEVGLDSAANAFSFCPLPSPSYHVTAWDGINEENLSQLAAPGREKFADYLLGLPATARHTPHGLIPPAAFDGVIGADPVSFRFAGLSIWGDAVLVARLAPADEKSAAVLEHIRQRREHLDEQFAPLGRPKPTSSNYNPHVSLGYFAHPRGAHSAAADLLQWEGVFRCRAAACHIAFHSISAYAFESMETFLKLEFAG